MTDDQLIQYFTVESAMLTLHAADLIDSGRDNRISEKLYSLRTEILRRMGDKNVDHYSKLLDNLSGEVTEIVELPNEEPDTKTTERFFIIRRDILDIIARTTEINDRRKTAHKARETARATALRD